MESRPRTRYDGAVSRSVHETLADFRFANRNGDDGDRVMDELAKKRGLKSSEHRERTFSALAEEQNVSPSAFRASLEELTNEERRALATRARARLKAGHVDYDTLYNLALWSELLGETQEALDLYGRAIDHVLVDGGRARDVDAWFNRGLVLQLLGRRDEAAVDFRWVIEHGQEKDVVDDARRKLVELETA